MHSSGSRQDKAGDLVRRREDSDGERGENAAVASLAPRGQGLVFSMATSAAINTIQVTLITPSANRAAISAHEQPIHQPPLRTPIEQCA